jgi:hypothetical protein
MRPAGFLVLEEVAIWLGHPRTNRCRNTRRLLARHGIGAAIPSAGPNPSLWRFADLEPLKHLAPGAHVDDELEAA